MQSVERQFSISQQDLAAWGVNDLAYVKKITKDGEEHYAIHAADGTRMAVMADREVAWAAIRQNELEPVSVH